MSADRIPCCVPFCRRTASREKFPACTEIICGKHWRTVKPVLRARHRQWNRRYRKMSRRYMAAADKSRERFRIGQVIGRMLQHEGRLWENIKADAIEAAAGITA